MKKRIAGLVVAFGVLVGSAVGFNALADQTDRQQTGAELRGEGSEQRVSGFLGRLKGMRSGFGGMMHGFNEEEREVYMGEGDAFMAKRGITGSGHGFGMMGRGFGQDLTEEEQAQLKTIREEMQSVMEDSQAKMLDLSEKFRAAMATGDKETILTAWNEMKLLREGVQTKSEPFRAQLEEIIGEDFWGRHMEDSWMDQQMAELETANPKKSQEIIEDLKDGRGPGMRGGIGGMHHNGLGNGAGGSGPMGRGCHGNRR